MELKKLKHFLLSKLFSEETYPFGPETLVLKVMGKIFALVGLNEKPLTLSLKCDPDDAQIQRQIYNEISAGYHLNKEHWNTVVLSNALEDDLIFQLIDDSYKLVVKGLRKKDQERLKLQSLA
ncbi:MAG: MmcQ/YjbR family DNA-binding protein [Candidatus Marinimicrobia bacterium]|nr:MmcQ/YjbR family DNA-binding protein [Candidatus Neomarinimicrobiota bacterium]MBT3495605.1 MmcQ/YjbR family DNA-binding protein [Candidatus Neomarinimicrobiota bacterium]MBT3692560.1 MmcQ/YjbR family DNA-binding protein [Candidatus Neomarinimicrobiota bacterium]MBT3732495.1 MmcQ/YjbR family DNA-binding protein [Candidatus Neomarinimicrobiota bacterium]MBT4144608.1 MmcQ/YjbR family DNA-binding protein [Candidatus Neomarinimicrobiota bacterium]